MLSPGRGKTPGVYGQIILVLIVSNDYNALKYSWQLKINMQMLLIIKMKSSKRIYYQLFKKKALKVSEKNKKIFFTLNPTLILKWAQIASPSDLLSLFEIGTVFSMRELLFTSTYD